MDVARRLPLVQCAFALWAQLDYPEHDHQCLYNKTWCRCLAYNVWMDSIWWV